MAGRRQTAGGISKVALLTFGCSKNLVDSEVLYRQLQHYGVAVSSEVEDAEAVIINTCGFIDKAKEENIEAILEAVELKKQGKIQKLIVAGCLVERYRAVLEREIPEVDRFVGTEAYGEILQELSPWYQYALVGERALLTPSHYAYVKIAEGCDHPCAFCAIPLIRGKYRSKPMEVIEQEVRQLVDRGVKEIILIAQDTTYYGKDLYGERKLAMLLQRLSDIPGVAWLRLHYAYPAHFPLDVLDLIAERENICAYLDMPLQHISDRVLKSMRRGITKRRTLALLEEIYRRVPNITLRTTFLVGYPNEREEDFLELCDFVQAMEFDRLGVFTFSYEEGTAAAILGDPIPQEEKERRAQHLMEIQREIALRKNRALVGKRMRILIDEEIAGEYVGRTEGDSPEVDQVVYVRTEQPLQPGMFIDGEIEDAAEYDLFAVAPPSAANTLCTEPKTA